MALVESIKIGLGTRMPHFELNDSRGKLFRSESLYGKKGLLAAFTCNHCPYAQAVWPRLIRLAAHAGMLGVKTVGINPNIHPAYPEDSPEEMAKKVKEWGVNFPYLVDETQDIARAFQAQCTPDLYLFNAAHELVYHGRLDDNWKEPEKVKREELKEAVENLSAGKLISKDQKPSMGCSIKWRE